MDEIRSRLMSLADEKYRAFSSSLIPELPPERVLGVRMPALRALERELRGSETAKVFMAALPHEYHEENNLHGLLINSLSDFGETLAALEPFLPHVDNWATCDLLSPRSFKRRPAGLLDVVRGYMASGRTYTVRFGIGVLMGFYLDEGFDPGMPELVAECCCDEYYVNMMIAWYFATALARREAETLPFIEGGRLSPWVHNRAIQKAVESRRISEPLKAYLKTLKRR